MDDAAQPKLFDVGGVLMPRPFQINRLGHFGLYAEDLAKADDFYGRLLGFRCTDERPVPPQPETRLRFYTYNSDHHALVLLHNSIGKARDDRYAAGVTVNQMSFQVGTLEEVVNAHAEMVKNGAPIWRIGRDVPGSNWAVYFYDADRHTVELFYGMEQVGWDRRSKPLDQFLKFATRETPALPQPAEQEEIASVEAQQGGTLSVDRGAPRYNVGGVLLPRPFKIVRGGPVGLFVADLDAAVRFYRDSLGLKVTEHVDCEGETVVFLRANAEHHVVSLAPVALRAKLGLGEHTTLMSYGLQVGSYRQLRDAVAYLEENGCRRIELPSELFTGIDYAAHFLDPDGHCIQLYYYMEQVGWDGALRPKASRRTMQTPWPEAIEAAPDTYGDRTFLGPLG